MIELLSPVGDFDCLKAAVQSGSNAVYFGAKSFGARAFASNFDDSTLEQAITYAKLRNVKTNLTLNTLIKQDEFEDAINLAKKAYTYGIDAIIVQDLGLALELIKRFPDLDIHGSTQMTVHNLEGALALQELGFKRVVLSRELSLDEIKYICENTNLEIEVFIHGALCICYSGQCLFSSMIGGRSGNRGKCAQPCRLPYELLSIRTVLNHSQSDKKTSHFSQELSKRAVPIDKGYLLSPRDLCSLEYLPNLIDSGVTSLKIEGRMKSPEYVATVTRIYRKYIDLALNNPSNYKIDINDKKTLMQVYNRGGFSSGHLSSKANKNLVFKEKQNNMGLYLGTISKYNKNKGIVTCNLNENLSIGDSISFENENTKYTISELMENSQNIKNAYIGHEVAFGRMKGNINLHDKIYKISDKSLTDFAISSFARENIKNSLLCKITIKSNSKILVTINCPNFDVSVNYTYNYIPQPAQNSSLTTEKIVNQFNKTIDTPFIFKNFDIELDNNLFIPISVLNDIRRVGINSIEQEIINSFKRKINSSSDVFSKKTKANYLPFPNKDNIKISLLLNVLNLDYDYHLLKNVDKLYIPLKYFKNFSYNNVLQYFSNNFNLYIFMPTIIRKDYIKTTLNILKYAFENFNINGIVVSNISQIKLIENIKSYYKNLENELICSKLAKLDIVRNYTFNIYNNYSIQSLEKKHIHTSTISPELDETGIKSIFNNSSVSKELIVYGNIPVMTMNYCPLGKTNKCYKECSKKCQSNEKFYLKDRMNMLFRLIPDNSQTISTIYNSKITSIDYKDFNINFARIDILDENIEEINNIINTIKNGKRFEGKDYTNGNLNRHI